MKVVAGTGEQAGVEASPLPAEAPPDPDRHVTDSESTPSRPALDIDALYLEHAPFIGRVLVRLVGDGSHVDDLIQETFIIAFRKRDSFDGRSAPRTWLYGIAARLASRHRRGLGRWLRARGALADEPTVALPAQPDRELDRARAAAVVRGALDRLPFKQREVFVLYELEEIEGAEIAALLGVPVNTVWTRLHHGRKRFQDVLRKQVRKVDHVD
jgi:RNA polymerase sigma-70 factor (ECF subfamily)